MKDTLNFAITIALGLNSIKLLSLISKAIKKKSWNLSLVLQKQKQAEKYFQYL